ncbi:MAG TPA: APC family permease [Mycobacteriales bacterium]
MAIAVDAVKRAVVGRPLRSNQLGETLLPKWLALPIFCSDPISSVAYATEEILLVSGLGGVAYLSMSKPVAAAVALLLVVVVASYRQTCYAYPSGGGAFVVSLDNLGPAAALTAASALLVDYVMTVAVSVVAGVAAITSAAPSLTRHAVLLSVAAVAGIALANLRGVRESGRAFAVPTYAFILGVFLLFACALGHAWFGHLPQAAGAHEPLHRSVGVGGLATVFLALRAFSSGCTALTGVEAISNGVPGFRPPKSRNAARTLVAMGTLAVTMFVGITVLAVETHARAYPSGSPSVISQLAAAVWGRSSALYVLFQAATAAILILAANTAFSGFPTLASILAENRYLPRQLHNRGDRLVFSNGILLLAGVAIALIVGFDANIDRLIQLYIIGVFTSFTLSQYGMVRHWGRLLAATPSSGRGRIRRAQAVNLLGAAATAVVLVIVVATKVEHGAWLALLAMVTLFVTMRRIRHHYDAVTQELAVPESATPILPARNHAVVLVSTLHQPTLAALAFAQSTRPFTLEALTVDIDHADTDRLVRDWHSRGVDVPLRVLDSPYREITRPAVTYLRDLHRASPRDVVTVFLPEYVVGHWWEQILHNQSAMRLKGRLLFEPGVIVISVPYHLRSASGPARRWGAPV